MKRIKRMIRNTILEIAIVIGMVALSVPLWQSFELNEYQTIAHEFNDISNINLEVSDFSDYILYQTTDDAAINNLEPISVNIINNNNTTEKFSLWITISKESTLNYQDLKISFNGEISYLKDHKFTEDNKNYYIYLTDGNITNNIINNELKLWIDSNSDAEITNKYLSFDIENKPEQVL